MLADAQGAAEQIGLADEIAQRGQARRAKGDAGYAFAPGDGQNCR